MIAAREEQTMRKAFLIALILMAASVSASPAIFIEAKVRHLSPSDEAFKSVYGSGWKYGGQVGLEVIKNLSLYFDGDYFSKKGKLTFTQEETKVLILALGAGLRYKFITGILSPYVAAGAVFYSFEEDNPIGTIKASSVGYGGRVGVLFRIIKGLMVDLNAGYTYGRMKPADFEFNIGGLELGAGLAFEF
jgi:hypothetical protein